ncbi:cache domain-containing protein [Massilia sp. SM-13]|uniref:cache domain-containing protein n=1 Tax=Pseudoduganella rhizocola TaxID=3382643 RepID=UPI0038B54650
MKRFLLTLFISLSAAWVQAAERGTVEEAQQLVEKAAAMMRTAGPARALTEFSNPQGSFTYRDLYIVVLDQSGVVRAHGALPHMIGQNVANWRDADDRYVMRELLQRAQRGETGPIRYKRPYLGTDQVRLKMTWFRKVDGYVIFCGAYP